MDAKFPRSGKLQQEMEKLEKDPKTIEELNLLFHLVAGEDNKIEFSRCVIFFLFGRLIEKEQQNAQNNLPILRQTKPI